MNKRKGACLLRWVPYKIITSSKRDYINRIYFYTLFNHHGKAK